MPDIPRTSTAEWRRRRREAIVRDDCTCQDCGEQGGDKGEATLHAHHITSVKDGGSDELSNLETLCASCHKLRHSMIDLNADPDEFRARLVATFYRRGYVVADTISVEVASMFGEPTDTTGFYTDLVDDVANDPESPIERCEAGVKLVGDDDAIREYVLEYGEHSMLPYPLRE